MLQPRHRVILTAAIWLAFALAPLGLDDWNLAQFARFMTYGIFAMSLAFIWGQAGILCFGQAIFFGLGGYCMALVNLGRLPWLGDSTVVGFLLAAIVPALAAYGLGRMLFHGKGLSGAYFGIVTLCAAVIVETIAQHWAFIGGFNGLLGIPGFLAPWRSGADAAMTADETYYLVLAAAAVIFAALLALARSPIGTVLAAIRDNDRRTAFFGHNIMRYKVWAFAVSALVSGLAGALFVKQFSFASPDLIGFGLSTEVLIWVAVGGRQVLTAAFLGAILVRSVEGALSDRLGNYWLLALGVLFVVTVVVMPSGLFGRVLTLPRPARLTERLGRSARP